ncbi:hypothetical protein [Candidatus Synechococcus spongiarum]|nr:hypothetical protein [Candidatus Synechococcus spongiarum]
MTRSEQHTAPSRIDLLNTGKRDHGSRPHVARDHSPMAANGGR